MAWVVRWVFAAGAVVAGGCAASSAAQGGAGRADTTLRGSDFDGDGRPDLAVGAPAAHDKTGRVYVYPGGASTTEPTVLAGALEIDARFGSAVAALGDVNRDGFDDLAVGSEGEGRVYVYYGGAGGLSSARRAVIVAPAGAEMHFGRALAGVGDLDGDGFADLAVADAGPAPRVYVFAGGTGGLWSIPRGVVAGPDGAASFGWALTGADVDGDGRAELLVSQPFAGVGPEAGRGSVFVFGARDGDWAEIDRPVAELSNPDPGTYDFGAALAVAGDVNGDGFADVLVGTFGDPGRAYVYRGTSFGLDPRPAVTLSAPVAPNARATLSVAAAGDVDGDGYGDVLVGSPGDGLTAPGVAAVYRGGPGFVAARPDAVVQGPVGAGFGQSVAAAGDGDILVGAPLEKRNQGRVYLFTGPALAPRGAIASPETLPAEFGRVAAR